MCGHHLLCICLLYIYPSPWNNDVLPMELGAFSLQVAADTQGGILKYAISNAVTPVFECSASTYPFAQPHFNQPRW